MANDGYKKELEVERVEVVRKVEEKGLVQVGFAKKKQEGFNTAVIGFKKMKKGSLSFQEEIWMIVNNLPKNTPKIYPYPSWFLFTSLLCLPYFCPFRWAPLGCEVNLNSICAIILT